MNALQEFAASTYQSNLDNLNRFWNGVGRYVISVYPLQNSYNKCFDMEKMLALAPLHLADQVGLPGASMPVVIPDWGTISTAKYWGGSSRFDSTGGNIFIDPVAQTIEEALALQPRPVNDPDMDAAQAIGFYRALVDRLQTDILWLRTPDMQGPLNTAGLVLNQEILFTTMYDAPQKVHAFLDKMTDFLIAYATYLHEQTQHHICGNLWPYTFFPDTIGLGLTEDLMPLLSTKLYKTFGLPYVTRLQKAFGRLHIHCCGAYGHHVKTLAASDLNIAALEFHYPATQL